MTRAALPQLPEITTKSDTRDILAHAAREAKGVLKDYFIVDVDAHVMERRSRTGPVARPAC
jgi:hypothetical protein